jgi:hypothetical protein
MFCGEFQIPKKERIFFGVKIINEVADKLWYAGLRNWW